jgi:hypothetical protein
VSISSSDQIVAALEQVAESLGDITDQVFEHYFSESSTSHALMDHMDQHMLGRMLDQVLLLLMEPGEVELEGYLRFETRAHAAYGVELPMYEALMNSVRSVIREGLGDGYDSDIAAAFDGRIQFLLNRIAVAAA